MLIARQTFLTFIFVLQFSNCDKNAPLSNDLSADKPSPSENQGTPDSSAEEQSDSIAVGHFNEEIPNAPLKRVAEEYTEDYRIQKGDNIISLLQAKNIEQERLVKIIEVSDEYIDLGNLQLNTLVKYYYSSPEKNELKTIQIDKNRVEYIEIKSIDNKEVCCEANIKRRKTKTALSFLEGSVESNLWTSMKEKQIDPQIIAQYAFVFDWTLDGGRLVYKGDVWKILVEELHVDGGEVLLGNLLKASYSRGDTTKEAYYFETEEGRQDYFFENGHSVNDVFLKNPVPGSRITSTFRKRVHPILKIVKPHLGIDYAARTGTAILAVGDGVIVRKGYDRFLGYNIKIRHNKTFQTVYGHMKSFRKGFKKGSYVKKGDVIGYIGSSGRATGPHLHFSLLKNNRYINPKTFVSIKKSKLMGDELERFKQYITDLNSKKEGLAYRSDTPSDFERPNL